MPPQSRTDDPHPLIRRLRAIGTSDRMIFQRLVGEGWSAESLAPSLGIYPIVPTPTPKSVPLPTPSAPSAPRPKTETSRGAITLSLPAPRLLLLGLGGAVLSAALFFLLKPPVVYSVSLTPDATTTTATKGTYGAQPALADPTYYNNVKQGLIAQKASFIEANLSAMQLVVYIKGVNYVQAPILAKGRAGSWWETPAGLYQVEQKEKTHYSSFGEVALPSSIDFQGNFSIHGWPTSSDGTPVTSNYSGGSIRLSTENAQKVYDLADIGMPILIYSAQPTSDEFAYQLKVPKVSAGEYLLADAVSGTVLASQAADTQVPIASITKMITALTATNSLNLDALVKVPPGSLVYSAVPRLHVGQSIRAYDLLFLLLQESSNEAAEAFARQSDRGQFIDAMNREARTIGLSHTTFNDPSGAEDDLSSANDLFTLLRYLQNNRRFVFEITTGNLTETAYGAPRFASLSNFNIIKNAPADLLGGKVGETNQAGETYAGIFSVDLGGEKRQIAVVVLGSNDVQSDIKKLLQFVKQSYAPAD